jgi:GNAT superfamily N-acetyltransferase/predicted Zn-ribbon and HTH transcriptional regulator
MICQICQYENEDKKAFATHLQRSHNLTSKQYTIDYLQNGVEPVCLECGEKVRYVSFEFKRYCKNHSNFALSESGKKGGKNKQTWNKGQTKETNEIIARMAEECQAQGNHFYGKKHSQQSIFKMCQSHRISEEEFLQRANNADDLDILIDYSQYEARQKLYIPVKCKICGEEDKKTLMAIERGSKCRKCFPLNTNSKPQNEVQEFIHSLGFSEEQVLKNNRTVLAPKELDIYIPDKNFAIEFNGLHWHSELYKENNDHQNKTFDCMEKGIQLFHIFSDEWQYKQDIVKSMIQNRLGKNENKVYARQCSVYIVPQPDRTEFFNNNHISEDTKSKIAFGLYYNDKLMSCISLRKPYSKKYDESCIEIARFATEKGYNIVAGFSKLMKYVIDWCKDNNYSNILTYADLRFGQGKVYEQYGFQYQHTTSPDYWYTDGEIRENRLKYKATDLLSENQVAENAGVIKIYGCGSHMFLLNI